MFILAYFNDIYMGFSKTDVHYKVLLLCFCWNLCTGKLLTAFRAITLTLLQFIMLCCVKKESYRRWSHVNQT